MTHWWAGLAACAAVTLVATDVLALLAAFVLMGLPHGWDAATSGSANWSRFSSIATFLFPVSVGTYLMLRVRYLFRARRN